MATPRWLWLLASQPPSQRKWLSTVRSKNAALFFHLRPTFIDQCWRACGQRASRPLKSLGRYKSIIERRACSLCEAGAIIIIWQFAWGKVFMFLIQLIQLLLRHMRAKCKCVLNKKYLYQCKTLQEETLRMFDLWLRAIVWSTIKPSRALFPAQRNRHP